jgi:hypothetical protein
MKNLTLLMLSFSLGITAGDCSSSTSNADKWSSEQKTAWTQHCMEFMSQEGVDEKNAKGFCDCMLSKTSEKYTPETAAAINKAEERKLWEECDNNW